MKKYLKRVIALLLLVAVGASLYKGFSYFIVDNHSSRLRTQYPEFYNTDEVDALFVGSSHTVYAANTVQLTENLGKSYFNMATSAQDISLTYYVIKDALKAHPEIKQIYCEFSVSRLMLEAPYETSTYAVTDYMRSFLCKAEMLVSSYDITKYINAFSALRRNIDPTELPKVDELQAILDSKQKSSYVNKETGAKYKGRGQWENTGYLNETEFYAVNLYSTRLKDYTFDDIQEREFKYLLAILEYCEKNGIELTFLIEPYNECYLMHFETYNEITDYVKGIITDAGCSVIDFNLVKDEYLDLKAYDYQNLDHVKYSGSQKIADFLELYITNPEGDYFCDTLEEKYPHDDDIVAIGYERLYANSNGEVFSKRKDVGSDLANLVVDLSAISYVDIPATARLWELEKDEDGEWCVVREVEGENTNELTTRFFIEPDFEINYKMQLLDPETGAVLYETISNFDMYEN